MENSNKTSYQEYETEDELDIIIIVNAKQRLETIDESLRNPDYKYIYKCMSEYLLKYCTHIIETDLIDVDPDRSVSIKYCSKCFHTFK